MPSPSDDRITSPEVACLFARRGCSSVLCWLDWTIESSALRSSSSLPSLEDWLVSPFVQMAVILATETSEEAAIEAGRHDHIAESSLVGVTPSLRPLLPGLNEGDMKEGIEAPGNTCSSKNVLVNPLWSYLRDLSYTAAQPDMLGPQVPSCLSFNTLLHTACIQEYRCGDTKAWYNLAKSNPYPEAEIREAAGIPVFVGISL
jgi:hypothetical protein